MVGRVTARGSPTTSTQPVEAARLPHDGALGGKRPPHLSQHWQGL